MECSAEVSTQAPIGLTIIEKLIGLIMIAVGALWLYTTYTNMTSISMSAIFLVLSVAMIGIGILLVIAKFE
jgi:membrane protein YdbS with pleckstrin-like domain